MKVAGSCFTVVGAGRSGIAAANSLASRGADVILVESRADSPRPPSLHPDVAFRPGTNSVRQGDIAVLSPGISEVSPVRAEAAAAASEVMGEVELFYRLCPAPILAITGTDGKSTVTTMLGAIIQRWGKIHYVGGNLGNPLCEALLEAPAITKNAVIVAEISGFQLTTCRDFRPRVAIVTNISEDHINYHGSFSAYQAAKRRIWDAMTAQDVLIINGDDPFIAQWTLPAGPAAPQVLTFSTGARASGGSPAGPQTAGPPHDAWFNSETLWITDNGGAPVALMSRAELPLMGIHNVANALAAALAAVRFGVPTSICKAALERYAPLAHRLAPIREREGVMWINDSKATNPNATTAALNASDGRPLVLLAGGSAKETNFGPLGDLIRARSRHAILFGATRCLLKDAIGEHPTTIVETLEQAVAAADALARPGDVVLLSPACASFDQFKGFAHRGDVFTALVAALP